MEELDDSIGILLLQSASIFFSSNVSISKVIRVHFYSHLFNCERSDSWSFKYINAFCLCFVMNANTDIIRIVCITKIKRRRFPTFGMNHDKFMRLKTIQYVRNLCFCVLKWTCPWSLSSEMWWSFVDSQIESDSEAELLFACVEWTSGFHFRIEFLCRCLRKAPPKLLAECHSRRDIVYRRPRQ